MRWTKSSTGFLRWAFVVAAVSAAGFLVLPHSAGLVWVAIALMIVMCIAVFTSRGVFWAQIGEADTLEKLEALLPWNVPLEPIAKKVAQYNEGK